VPDDRRLHAAIAGADGELVGVHPAAGGQGPLRVDARVGRFSVVDEIEVRHANPS
jgi:hypothetical protein